MATVTTVTAKTPLCKTWNPQSKTFNTYPTNVAKVTTANHSVSSPEELVDLLNKAATLNAAITLGQPKKKLNNERRKGQYDKFKPLSLFALDVDKIPMTLETFLRLLPEDLQRTRAVWQPSASLHISPDPSSPDYQLAGHLFYLLSNPVEASTMQMFIQNICLSVPQLTSQITLSPSKLFLSWPVDQSIYQPSRLLYITPPINSPNPDHSETQIRVIEPPIPSIPSAIDSLANTLPPTAITTNIPVKARLKEQSDALIHSLREKEHFKPLRQNSKHMHIDHASNTLPNPEPGICHLIDDTDPVFLRLNINDGDSGAYYVYKYNPEFIHNFKGEPKIPTKKFDPEFYKSILENYSENPDEIQKSLEENPGDFSLLGPLYRPDENQEITFPFVDPERDTDNIVTYNTHSHAIHITTHGNEKRMQAILNSKNRPTPDKSEFPTWNVTFNPTKSLSHNFDFINKELNTFSPSELMRTLSRNPPKSSATSSATSSTSQTIPFDNLATELYKIAPTHYQVIHNAVGGNSAHLNPTNPETSQHLMDEPELFIETNYFINWLSFIFQKREKTRIAWLLQGTTKTGKSALVELIILPILSKEHSVLKEFKTIDSRFTGWMEKIIVLGLDETKAKSKNQEELQQKLKHEISQELLSLEEKHVKVNLNVPSYTNFIFCTNYSDAIKMEDAEASRFNVGYFQNRSLMHQPPFNRTNPPFDIVSALKKEREAFLTYMLYIVTPNRFMATTALNNNAKNILQDSSMTYHMKFARDFLSGDLYQLMNQLPTLDDIELGADFHLQAQMKRYHAKVQSIFIDWLLTTTEASSSTPNWVRTKDVYMLYILTDYEAKKPKSQREFLQMAGHMNMAKSRQKQRPRSHDLLGTNNAVTVFHQKMQFKTPTHTQLNEIIQFCADVITSEQHEELMTMYPEPESLDEADTTLQNIEAHNTSLTSTSSTLND